MVLVGGRLIVAILMVPVVMMPIVMIVIIYVVGMNRDSLPMIVPEIAGMFMVPAASQY